jgi:hypothetical protein
MRSAAGKEGAHSSLAAISAFGTVPSFPAAYPSADRFVLRSAAEAFGNVLLEAMTSGLPSVTALRHSWPSTCDTLLSAYREADNANLARHAA